MRADIVGGRGNAKRKIRCASALLRRRRAVQILQAAYALQKYRREVQIQMSSTRTWTKPQLDAIEHRGSDLLLSAAAGSGKTAVLTARLIRLLTSPDSDVKPSEVLAVTFTNAASAENERQALSPPALLSLCGTDPSSPRQESLSASIASGEDMHHTQLLSVRDKALFCKARSPFGLSRGGRNRKRDTAPSGDERDCLRIFRFGHGRRRGLRFSRRHSSHGAR